MLRKKTVILVTNALQYLPSADNIVWLDNGAIKAQGTYQQLVAAGLDIAELVHVEEEKQVKVRRSQGLVCCLARSLFKK